jgi:hypothetical protein
MKMKAITFNRKTTVSHTAYDGIRIRAGVRSGAVRATVMATHSDADIDEAKMMSPDIAAAEKRFKEVEGPYTEKGHYAVVRNITDA